MVTSVRPELGEKFGKQQVCLCSGHGRRNEGSFTSQQGKECSLQCQALIYMSNRANRSDGDLVFL